LAPSPRPSGASQLPGLAVEEHEVVVPHVPLHRPPDVQGHARGGGRVAQVLPRPVVAHHVLGARPDVGAVLHQPLQLLDVEPRDALRHRQVQRDGLQGESCR